MIYIFDLDYTLLDTSELKKDMAIVLGVSEEQFACDEKKLFKDKGVNYNPHLHLEQLLAEKNITKQEFIEGKTKLASFLTHIDHYLLPGAAELIKALHERKDELILFSFGDAQWQQMKIENLGIKNMFDDLIVEKFDKVESGYLQEFADAGEEIVLVNDKLIEGLEMKHVLTLLGNKCRLISIDGPYTEKEKEKLREANEFDSLLEVEQVANIFELKQKIGIKPEQPVGHEFKIR